MTQVDNLIKQIESFRDGIITAVKEALLDNEREIVGLNADIQLYEKGETSLGVSIDSYAPYSALTVYMKQKKGQPTDRVTLRDTHDFESSFFLDVKDDEFEIKAEDWKTEELQQKYGDEILGLNDEHIGYVSTFIILPALYELRDKLIR